MITRSAARLWHFGRSRPALLAITSLLVGATAGVASAQVLLDRSHYLNTGLFSIGRTEGARFSVTLDDHPTAGPARVAMQFITQGGAPILGDEITLQPGGSTTLEIREPGVFRGHARIIEPSGQLSSRRLTVGTMEIFDVQSSAGKRFICHVGGPGRIPDSHNP